MSLDDTDLFGAAAAAAAGADGVAGSGGTASLPPLAVRMRPRTVDEVRGSRSLEDVFVETVGGGQRTGEELTWLKPR